MNHQRIRGSARAVMSGQVQFPRWLLSAVACGPPGPAVPGAGALVPVQAPGRVVADPDNPVFTALAADGDLPLPQIDVAAPQAGSYGI